MIKVEVKSPLYPRNIELEKSSSFAQILAEDRTTPCPIAFVPKEILRLIVLELDPVSLARAANTCKTFYFMTKDSQVWHHLFMQFLPHIKILQTYTPEQQFKCVFEYFVKQRGYLKKQKQRILREVDQLRGTADVEGEIDTARKAYQKMETDLPDAKKATEIRKYLLKVEKLNNRLTFLVGPHYNGTDSSVAESSALGRIYIQLQKTENLCKDQKTFERMIYFANLQAHYKHLECKPDFRTLI